MGKCPFQSRGPRRARGTIPPMTTSAFPAAMHTEPGHPGGGMGTGGLRGNLFGPFNWSPPTVHGGYGDDVWEDNPNLQWPNSVRVYDKMRRSDAMCAAVLRQTRNPIMRTRWQIDPNGAPPNVVNQFAEDLSLPVMGLARDEQPRPLRRKGRFSFYKHLSQAFLSTVFGHIPFVIVTHDTEDTNGIARLKKLSPRMPQTLSKIDTDPRDGGLRAIEQYPWVGADPLARDRRSNEPIRIEVFRLVMYVNDMEGSNWYGSSMYRPVYPNWMMKERFYRGSVMVYEKNGMGVPFVEGTVPGAGPGAEAKAQEVATKYRMGEGAGGYVPYGFKITLKGVEGTVPDALPYIQHHNEEIGKNALAMFMSLGTTQTGSRALGGTFLDAFTMSLQAVAEQIADTFNEHVIEDFVDWNYGETTPAPRVVPAEIGAESDMALDALTELIRVGAVRPDDDLERYLRQRGKLPQRAEDDSAAPAGQAYKYDLDFGIITINERRAAIGLPPVPGGDVPPTPPGTPDTLENVNAMRARRGFRPLSVEAVNVALASRNIPPIVMPAEDASHRLAAGDEVTFRRALTAVELASTTDFVALAARHDDAVGDLVTAWGDIRSAQLDELTAQIAELVDAGDIAALGDLTVTTGPGAELIETTLLDVLDKSVDDALAEASRQGTTIARPDLGDRRALLTARAQATDQLLGKALSETAGRRAVALAGPGVAGDVVAAGVREHIEGLSDQYLRKQLGGTVTGAENAGRLAVAEQGSPTRIIASELMDASTCGPCADIDGTEYDSLADAEADYPTGGFKDCDGREDCRGTIVTIYGEADPEA